MVADFSVVLTAHISTHRSIGRNHWGRCRRALPRPSLWFVLNHDESANSKQPSHSQHVHAHDICMTKLLSPQPTNQTNHSASLTQLGFAIIDKEGGGLDGGLDVAGYGAVRRSWPVLARGLRAHTDPHTHGRCVAGVCWASVVERRKVVDCEAGDWHSYCQRR